MIKESPYNHFSLGKVFLNYSGHDLAAMATPVAIMTPPAVLFNLFTDCVLEKS
jgi:hypothetical protein